ncbi:membrane hypothetical protein [Syntrophobacter sp. SbD1]|nr:membrane hypothetical protein [Syntrophobacter sp. SbD1]
MKLNFRHILKLIITVGLIVYLLQSCHPQQLLSTILDINISLACIIFIINLALLACGALNLWLLLNSICRIPFRSFMNSYIYGYAINLFAPGQLGDASVAIFLKDHGIYYSQSALAYAVDKLITLIFILLIGCIGAKYIIVGFTEPIWIFGIPIICVLVGAGGSALLLYIPYDTGKLGRIKSFITNIYKESLQWKSKGQAITINIVITILRWLLLSVIYYLAFRAFGVDAKWPAVGIIPIVSTLIGYIPISIGGIGAVELCAVYLFSLISIDRVYVIDVYIFLRFTTYVQAAVILGLCNWQCGRIRTVTKSS